MQQWKDYCTFQHIIHAGENRWVCFNDVHLSLVVAKLQTTEAAASWRQAMRLMQQHQAARTSLGQHRLARMLLRSGGAACESI